MIRYLVLIAQVGLIVFTPVIVFASDKVPLNYGQTAVGSLIALLTAWGVYKCILIARRKTTNAKCALSLGFSLAAFFSIYGMAITKQYFADPRMITAIAGFIALIFFTISMVLAVLGLVEYNKKFTQGKKQAVWAIVLNSMFFLIVVAGILIGVAKNSEKQKEMYASNQDTAPIVNSDLNFTLNNPGKPYVKIKPETISASAKVAFMRGKPQIYYMLLPERIGIDRKMKTESLADIAQANLKAGSQNLNIINTSEKIINGMRGLYFISDATINNRQVSYVHWVCSINGFCYQQIAFSNRKNKASLLKEAEIMFGGFKQIDPGAVCYSEGSIPLKNYESNQFGYSLNLDKTSWLKWIDVNKNFPGADIAGITGDRVAAFIISPILLKDFNPGDEYIIEAFLQSMGIDRNDEKLMLQFSSKAISFQDYVFTYSKSEDSSLFDYKIKISMGEDRAFCIAVWSNTQASKVDGYFKQIDESIKYLKIHPYSESERFDAHGKLIMADIVNRVGIVFENKKNNEKALDCYKLAIAYDPKDDIFWDNAMKVFNRVKQHQFAVQFLKEYEQQISFSNNTISWFAWHLAQSGRKNEALEKYQYLFSSGYENNEDFKYYITLLTELGELEAVDPAYNSYLKQQDNQDLRLHQAQIWFGQNEFEKALNFLKSLDQNSSDVIREQIYNLQELGRYNESLKLCDNLIRKKSYAGDGYFLKGKSEYRLKRYTDAKISFEKSLKHFPGNKTINEYLMELSGILGQGDNSIIKKIILPVPLPEKVMAQMTKPVIPDYIKGFGAYYQQYCYGYQWDPDGTVKYTMRHKIKILNSTGVNNFSTYTIDFNPLYEQLYINNFLIRNKDGDVIAKKDESSYFIVDKNDTSLKSHERTLNMPIPQLSPGCTIEIVSTKILGNYDCFPFVERILSGTYPILNSMVYVLGNAAKYSLKAENGVEIVPFNKGKMAYAYAPMIYQREPKQLPFQMFLPCVHINGIGKNWAAQGEDYLEKIQSKLNITDDIKALAKGLINKNDDNNAKIAKLYNYLQNHYKYLGIEFGSRGEMPYDASKTVNNKYGDCKDHAVLFHHLLKGVGIQNYLTLLNSTHPLQKEMPSRDQFDHMINYIPGQNARFIDTTDKNSATNLLPPTYLAGREALVLEPGNVHFLRIPDYNTQDTMINVHKFSYIVDKILHVEETIKINGHHAAFMRRLLKNKNIEEQQDWGQSLVQAYYPSGTLEKFEVKNLMKNDEVLIIDCLYAVSARLYALKNKVIVNTTGIWEPYYLLSEPANNRKTKFEIKIPFQFSSDNEIKLSEGFEVGEYPKDHLSSETEFGSFDMKFDNNKRKLKYQLQLTAVNGVFSKDKYQAYYQFMQNALTAASPHITLLESN